MKYTYQDESRVANIARGENKVAVFYCILRNSYNTPMRFVSDL